MPEEGTYLVLPTSVDSPVLPAQAMVFAVGEKGDLGIIAELARAKVESLLVVETIRVDRGATVSLRLAMRQAGTVRGIVRDRAGMPCPGAWVEVGPARLKGGQGRKVCRTDEKGGFEAPGILGAFEAKVTLPDGRLAWTQGEVKEGGFSKVELVVGKAGPLHGVVVDPDGRPVAGARVQALTDRQWANLGYHAPEGREQGLVATTGPDGSFHFEEGKPEPEPNTLHADAGPERAGMVQGFDPFSIPAEGIRIVLRPTLSISGRVLDGEGRPVKASVNLHRADAPRTVPWPSVDTSEDGTFRFVNLPEGDYALVVGGTAHATVTVRARSGDQGVEIRLSPTGRTLHGQVLSPAGDPFPRLIGPEDAPPWKHFSTMGNVYVLLLSQDPRAAESPIPRESEVARASVQHEAPDFQLVIPSGSGRLWIALMVCGRMVEVREVAGEGDVLFNVDLAAIAARAGAFRVVGLDAVSGIPIPVLRVHLIAEGKGPTWGQSCRPGDAVGPLSPGRYSVMVGATGYENLTLADLVVEPDTLGETIEVRLRRP